MLPLDLPDIHSLEDGGVLTDCNIRTIVPEDEVGIDIRAAPIAATIIMKVWCIRSDILAHLSLV